MSTEEVLDLLTLRFGLTYKLGQGSAVTVAYTRAFNEEIDGSSPFTGPQTGSVRMDQHELEVSWAWTFD